MRKPALPIAAPSGLILLQMSAQRRHEVMSQWFEMTGGVEKLVAVSDRNDANYLEILKIWAKGMAKPVQQIEHHGGSLEDMLDELERSEKAQVIGGTFTESEDNDAG